MTFPRILLVGNYEPDRQHSMLRYGAWLAKALKERGYDADLIAPRLRLATLAGNSATARKWLGFLDKFVLFSFELRRRARSYDLIHICDHTNASYALVLRFKPVSLTCHDLIHIKVVSGEIEGQGLSGTARYLQRLARLSLRRVSNIVYVSEATQSDFLRLIRRPDGVTGVIHNPVIGFGKLGKDGALELMKQAKLAIDRPFLLHIGSNLWYKNRIGAVRLFGELRRRPEWTSALPGAYLVCIGPPLPDGATEAAEGWQKDLIVMSDASPELIEALYTRAAALLFPSLDQGFGWPIIEAQACGCPVITSNREPMRSIAGPAALLIDPTDVAVSSQTIADRWNWLMMQSDRARSHAEMFSEQSAAARYAEFVAKVLAAAAPVESRSCS